MNMRRFLVTTEVTAEIIVNDEDVIERVTGPDGDEWRSKLYDLHTRDDVLNHLAYNCIVNGRRDVTMLDGWADLSRDVTRMDIIEVDPLYVNEVKP